MLTAVIFWIAMSVLVQVNFFLLRRLLGVRTKGSERQGKVSKLAKGEILMLNIGSMSSGARVIAVKNDLAKLQLTSPVCTSKGEKIALSRRVEKHWRLIGWGQIQAGTTLEVPPCPLWAPIKSRRKAKTSVEKSRRNEFFCWNVGRQTISWYYFCPVEKKTLFG